MTPAQYRKWRFYAESLIQRAIDMLDALDGCPDLEDGGDLEPDGHEEPSTNPVEPWFRPAPAASRAAA
ncbi:hypothetical protein [Microvirga lotononidis]|uniref:hypothetical protein n=1 Tax=Microvirga lotononidis TaxID=864069 RepID=UPI0012B561F2|nr:hypothetical protein [Microvirga lotononidis]WQO31606.1 hypothetical protein U0023_29995 [Microvirga lotononidis]